MKRACILVAGTLALFACNRSDKGETTSGSSAAAAVATKPSVNAEGDIVDPTLPAAADENTSDITASTYKQELDSLDREVADLK